MGGGGGILQNAPIFALDCNITRVDIQVKLDSSQSVLDLLMPFKKLKSISLHQMTDSRIGFMSVLESKEHFLETIDLVHLEEIVSMCNIFKTYPKIKNVKLLYLRSEAKNDSEADHEYYY